MPAHRLTAATLRWLLLLFLIAPFGELSAELRCNHIPQIIDAYLKNHYAFKSLTDQLKAHTVEQYIRGVDPSKTMLLEGDVAKLKQTIPTIFATMPQGNCAAIDNSRTMLHQRAKEVEAYVREFLGKDYKLDETTEINIDPKKRGYPKTVEERKELTRKMVHFQISNYLLSDMKLPDAKKQLIHRYELITKRLAERKPGDDAANFIEAFALGLDPHSSFFTKDAMEDFQIQMQLSLEGIGASLSSQDGFTVIEELIPGGSAERTQALRPKDKIIAVAQDGAKPVPVIDMELREVVRLIRGKKGTKVRLTILRQAGTAESFDLTIVRDKIDIKEQAAKLTYESRKVNGKSLKIAVIDLPSFYGGGGKGTRSCSVDVRKLLEEAAANKADGVVLNLARNGGGLLEEAVRIASLFLNKGGLVATKDTESRVQVLSDEDPHTAYAGPLVILTSRLSASASEILAGALKDYRRALVVGADHTFGKGSVQIVTGLPIDLGGIKVTTGMFFLPAGESTQHSGVTSDITLPPIFNTEDIGENKLDYSLPPQKIKPFLGKEANATDPSGRWAPIDVGLIPKLAEKSRERVAKDAKFAELKKSIDETMKNKGVVRLADIRKKSEEEKKTSKGKGKKDAQKAKELDQPLVEEAVSIMADMLTLKPST